MAKKRKARPKPPPIQSAAKRRLAYLRWKRWFGHVGTRSPMAVIGTSTGKSPAWSTRTRR